MKKLSGSKKETIAQLTGVLNAIRKNGDFILLGEVLENKVYSSRSLKSAVDSGLQSKDITQVTRDKIQNTGNKIRDILETRLNKAGLENKVNANITQFTLKNVYGGKDKLDLETKNYTVELSNILDGVLQNNGDLIKGFDNTPVELRSPERLEDPAVKVKQLVNSNRNVKDKRTVKRIKEVKETIDIFR